jgi:hypothetical protein
MCATAQRWKETITSAAEPDIERAKALLKKADKDSSVFVVESPLQFYIAQAVIRGRLSKKTATEWCVNRFDIDPAFIAPLKRSGGVRDLVHLTNRWSSGSANSVQAMMLRDFMKCAWSTTSGKPLGLDSRSGWRRQEMDAATFATRLCDVMQLYRKFLPPETRSTGPYYYSEIDNAINFSNHSGAISRASMSLYSALSNSAQDLLNDAYDPIAHFHDVTQAEMIAKMMGMKDERLTWRYEIFHHVPAVMRFGCAFLIIGKKPTLHLSGNALHNDAGPSVEWADGKKEWHIDGHELAQYGREIVLEPEKLTGKMLDEIRNEENRRIAIDKIGWGKYLAEIGATVADRRENWVDNTVEALIVPPEPKKETGRHVPDMPMRMLLSCRSTGRKYFLAVPKKVAITDLDKLDAAIKRAETAGRGWAADTPTQTIRNCEDAQNWFAGGAVTTLLPYAKHQIRIVGAS